MQQAISKVPSIKMPPASAPTLIFGAGPSLLYDVQEYLDLQKFPENEALPHWRDCNRVSINHHAQEFLSCTHVCMNERDEQKRMYMYDRLNGPIAQVFAPDESPNLMSSIVAAKWAQRNGASFICLFGMDCTQKHFNGEPQNSMKTGYQIDQWESIDHRNIYCMSGPLNFPYPTEYKG